MRSQPRRPYRCLRCRNSAKGREGDDGASQDDFVDFVAHRSGALLRTAFLLCGGDQGAAEDLLQDVLERAFPRWHRIAGPPEPYLRAALANAATNRWRARSRRVAETTLLEARRSSIRRARRGSAASPCRATLPNRPRTAPVSTSRLRARPTSTGQATPPPGPQRCCWRPTTGDRVPAGRGRARSWRSVWSRSIPGRTPCRWRASRPSATPIPTRPATPTRSARTTPRC
ncbi:MAG TPA: sigma factor [Pseudonocardiaceae bacterium]